MESRPNRASLNLVGITFMNFYPLDSGPLAAPADNMHASIINIREGLSVYVPSDLEKIKNNRGKIPITGKEK